MSIDVMDRKMDRKEDTDAGNARFPAPDWAPNR